ncbi:unnamed protein product [Discula destructiva]
MDRLRSGFHRKPRKGSPSRPTIVTDTSSIRSRNTTPEPGHPPSLQVPGVPVKKTSSPVFRTLRDLGRSHKRARSPATGSETTSPKSVISARDSPSDRFMVSPHPLSAVSPHDNNNAHPPKQNAQPKMPSFLTLSPHEIDAKFQEIIWLERERTLASASNHSPDFRWARLTSDHKKLDRYMNIQPWENNRVRLCVPPGKLDYINASPITLSSVSPARARARRSRDNSPDIPAGGGADRYIAMQGPKQKTTDHTWRMIVEQLESPAVIVMLTETHEGDHEKCYPYFPRSPGDVPLEIGLKDEFSDGFRASVRCEAIEETEAGEAIELRKLVIRKYKDVKSEAKSETASGTGTEDHAPATEIPADENGDVKMLSPAKTSPDEDAHPADDDDACSVTVQTGRASSNFERDAAATDAQQLTPQEDARSLAEPEYEERLVWHFLYKKWPDFGVPALEDIDSFFTLMRLSRAKNANPDNPRIVHCSAGVGRSGTFIALEHLMREMDTGVLENWDASLLHAPKEAAAAAISVVPGGGGKTSDSDAASIEGHNGHGEGESEGAEHGEDGSRMDVEEAGESLEEEEDDTEEASVDSDDLIFHTVNQLREQRRHMVQAEPQYHFLYQVLRKLWEDKYGVSISDSGNTAALRSLGARPVVEPPPRLSLGMDGEPAAKRLEFDPFVEE